VESDLLPVDDAELATLLANIEQAHLQPLWTQKSALLTPEPVVAAQPWLWPAGELHRLGAEAGRLVDIHRGGDRRVLALANPGLGGLPFATRTLWGAVQFLGGHEQAPAHRHSPGAVRFVLEGTGVWTLVNGDPCSMSAGDLVLTPGGNWHEHRNTQDTPMLWFDGLDLPLVQFLDAVFFEDGPDELARYHLPERSASEAIYGHAGLRPDKLSASDNHSPLLAYRRAETDATLTAMLAHQPSAASVSLTFVDPRTGRDALPTVRCQMLRLVPHRRTPTVRSVGSSIAVCFQGSGRTVIDGKAFDWKAGDIFAVPSWRAVDHEADDQSDLFLFTDAPLIEALRLERSQVLPAQSVTGAFDPTLFPISGGR
jgi:gentisate 1,2-dioxygenase